MTRISLPKTSDRLPYGGFSLIEMLVVIALIAIITVFAIPSVSSYFQISLNTTTREIASIVKETYNSALVTGRVHRLVYDLKNRQYWVESGPSEVLLDTKESLEKEEQRKKFSMTIGKEEEKPASPFNLEKSVTRKKLSLPTGVRFEDVLTTQSPDPITEGSASTHFFPHGLTEKTMIHLVDQSNHKVTLVISPLIGRTDLYERYATAAEVFAK